MKRRATTWTVASFIGCLVTGLLVLSAPRADAVDQDGFALTVNHRSLRAGQTLKVTASAKVTCAWAIEWAGRRHVEHGKTVTTTFRAPAVRKPMKYTLGARCFYSSGHRSKPGGGKGGNVLAGPTDVQTIVVTVPPSWFASLGVNVLPAGASVSPPVTGGHHPHGGLPGTGGPQLWPLIAGLVTALVGVALVAGASRRRSPLTAET